MVIIGAGPNRIGQGIEFDYCCVHAAFALREAGFEAIMVNCNPETVSTDYDTSDRLYFEPLTFEDVLNIVEKEQPQGVIVQFGGQTPLKLAEPLERGRRPDPGYFAGRHRPGGGPRAIRRGTPEAQPQAAAERLGALRRRGGCGRRALGYPVLVRPSLCPGRAGHGDRLRRRASPRIDAEAAHASPDHPVLIDNFLEDATEIDVDALCDGQDVLIGGVMEHIEKAGIHSGDSACALPPYSIGDDQVERLRTQTRALALELGVVGLMNIQFAIKSDTIYVLEVNPRASRTVPFVSKAIGLPLAKLATRVMLGARIAELGVREVSDLPYVSVKEAVFPFVKFPGVDVILGPEMRSTGEVMGIGREFRTAYLKSQLAAGSTLPRGGKAFLSVRNRDKRAIVSIGRNLAEMGFGLVATRGTAKVLERHGLAVDAVHKVAEGWRPNIVDYMKQDEIALVINTPEDGRARKDSYLIRRTAVMQNIPYYTTMDGAQAALEAIEAQRTGVLEVQPLQAYYEGLRT